MYNIKGPSKTVPKPARRGISQNMEHFREKNKETDIEENEMNHIPKPTFLKKSSPTGQRSESISPQHEEIVNFINESWNSVCAELEQEIAFSEDSSNGENVICYYEDEPCLFLQDFKPFDLESWWGKRLYDYVISSENTKS
ncbi:unnamed protein product [Phaedon cochleariae]|uniref:Uncharacterized protein n=1 Tax=Phaedon cochleariae TaxID=80249 RepID=A0A9P0GM98_PHACE|nr:unnamed protein product [Phaedon cochleariae]